MARLRLGVAIGQHMKPFAHLFVRNEKLGKKAGMGATEKGRERMHEKIGMESPVKTRMKGPGKVRMGGARRIRHGTKSARDKRHCTQHLKRPLTVRELAPEGSLEPKQKAPCNKMILRLKNGIFSSSE